MLQTILLNQSPFNTQLPTDQLPIQVKEPPQMTREKPPYLPVAARPFNIADMVYISREWINAIDKLYVEFGARIFNIYLDCVLLIYRRVKPVL